MLHAATQVYPDREEITVAIYDVRIPYTAERLHGERAAWGEFGDIEALDQHHYVLRIQPGAARELTA